MYLYQTQSIKTPQDFIRAIQTYAHDFDFIVRDVFEMGEEFASHAVEVNSDFQYFSILLCNPPKAYANMCKNPLRGAILLPPKQVVVYSDPKTSQTSIAYFVMEALDIQKILPEDLDFQTGLPLSCQKIIQLIEKSK